MDDWWRPAYITFGGSTIMKNLVLATLSAVLLIGCGDRGPEPESSAPLSEPEIDIWKATSEGAVDIVRQHIDYGTNINGTFVLEGVPGSGGTPLH